MTYLKRLSKSRWRGSRAFLADRRGVAAIEFALIAPIMIAFYFGLSELSLGISADRQVTHAASVIGDLATQVTVMDEAEIEDVMTATLAVLGVRPTDLSKVSIELSSYRKVPGANGGTIERVGHATMGTAFPAFDTASLSGNMLNTTSGVVVARVQFIYHPPTLAFLDNVALSETFLLKPRKSLSVPFGDGVNTDFTCTAASDLTVSCS